MILAGIDPGLSHFAVTAVMVPELVVVGADVWTSDHDESSGSKTMEYATRSAAAARWLCGTLRGWGVDRVASEGTAGLGEKGRGGKAIRVNHAAVFTIWGAVIGAVAVSVDTPLIAVNQATWKRHLVPHGKISDIVLYAALGAAGGDAIDSHLRMRRVRPSLRVHALDALGVARWAARDGGRHL